MKRVNGFLTVFNHFEEYETDEIYVTISLKGGIAEDLFGDSGTGEEWKVNPAAGRVYLKHLSNRCVGKQNAVCSAGKNGNYITVKSEREKIAEVLRELLALIYIDGVTDGEFTAAKEASVAEMKRIFKHASQRIWYYMFEFTEAGKGYVYNRMAEALWTMTKQELNEYVQHMVNPENSVIIVSGKLDETLIGTICGELTKVKKTGKEYLGCGHNRNISERKDCHLVKRGDDYALGSLYFMFPDRKVDLTERMVLLAYISEILFAGKAVVSVDAFDASVTYYGQHIDRYEMLLDDIWTAENVETAKERLLERFQSLLGTPQKAGVYLGEQIFCGIDVFKLCRYIWQCDAKNLREAYKKADMKVLNGAVISVKEDGNGRRASA